MKSTRGRRLSVVVSTVFLGLLSLAHADWVSLDGSGPAPPTVRILEQNSQMTRIEFHVHGYFEDEIDIDGETYTRVRLPECGTLMKKGRPDLPRIREGLIIPDDARMSASILESETETRPIRTVAPSKGYLTRDVNPESVVHSFGSVYGQDSFYPDARLETGDPYILRDFRGLDLEFRPFRYNPVLGLIEVSSRVVIELARVGAGQVNVKVRLPGDNPSREFADLYRSHFRNYTYSVSQTRYDTLPEPGRLLLIAASTFSESVEPLVQWKLQKGTPTKLALYPDSTGIGADQVKSYIQSEYNSSAGLTYVILVGDAPQIPTLHGSHEGAASDPCYVKLEGNDHYPDAFISRISATSPAAVENQVSKLVRYERDPDEGIPNADWYHRGTGIASNEGSPPDYVRCGWLRSMLLDYTYTAVDQIYDPGASASEVTVAINEGRSIVNYIGHGSGLSWGTTGFNVSSVHALENGSMNPFIIDVACLNGNFESISECFAEAWLRAGSAEEPKGAVGMFSSSTLASWLPPCDMQYEAVELLTQDRKNTFGGLCFNGVLRAMELHGGGGGSQGLKLMEQYNIFGDCSLLLRTDAPDGLQVSHASSILLGQSFFHVTVSEVEDALCALYEGGILYGSASTDVSGYAEISIESPGTWPDSLTLTVTSYNRVPYVTRIPVLVDTPDADFSGTPTEGDAPLRVEFTDLSTGDIDTWIWSFGDGDSAFVPNPIHIFYEDGEYDISLRVSGPMGEDSEVKTSYIRVSAPGDSAWMSSSLTGDPLLIELESGLDGEHTLKLFLANHADTAHEVCVPLRYRSDLFELLALSVDSSSFPGSDMGHWSFTLESTTVGDTGMLMLEAATQEHAYGLPEARHHLGNLAFVAVDTGTFVLDTCCYPTDHHLGYVNGSSLRNYVPAFFGTHVTVRTAICGDANGDGRVSTADAFHVLNFLGGVGKISSCWAANVNGDEFLTSSDGYYMLNYLGAGADIHCAPCSIQRPFHP
jgi:PKD repeat protein